VPDPLWPSFSQPIEALDGLLDQGAASRAREHALTAAGARWITDEVTFVQDRPAAGP
jgi:hypothetical protein